jgi:hypothetical protein
MFCCSRVVDEYIIHIICRAAVDERLITILLAKAVRLNQNIVVLECVNSCDETQNVERARVACGMKRQIMVSVSVLISAVRVANAKALIDKTEMAIYGSVACGIWRLCNGIYAVYMHMPLPLLPLEMAGQQNHEPPGTK